MVCVLGNALEKNILAPLRKVYMFETNRPYTKMFSALKKMFVIISAPLATGLAVCVAKRQFREKSLGALKEGLCFVKRP